MSFIKTIKERFNASETVKAMKISKELLSIGTGYTVSKIDEMVGKGITSCNEVVLEVMMEEEVVEVKVVKTREERLAAVREMTKKQMMITQ